MVIVILRYCFGLQKIKNNNKKRVLKNRRILVQVLVGDTVENMFSDVETSAKTWQSYEKKTLKSSFSELQDSFISYRILYNKGLQTIKKKSKTFFLAIHKNERQIFIEDKNNNSFLKTIYLYLHRCFLLNLRVLKNKFSFDEKQTLFVTASKHHSPAAGATQGYGVYLRNVVRQLKRQDPDNGNTTLI